MDAQLYYWDTFTNLKRNALYIGRYQAKMEFIDRSVGMVSAVAASSAIGGWVIWHHYAFIWASVVAAAQVINAVKPQLPYRGRAKALAGLAPELDALSLVAEADWLKVCRGFTTEDETLQLAASLKRKSQQATRRYFANMALPEDGRLLAMADDDARSYMSIFVEERNDVEA